jgi:hypothetical protein
MPVELPTPQGDTPPPEPPSPIVWWIVFIVIMLVGVVSTLLIWPKGEPTNTAWFWVRLLVFPSLAGALAYGLRLLYYEQETARLQAEEEVLAEDRAKAVRFAREPLAVVGSAYLCAIGRSSVSKQVAAGEIVLKARRAPAGKVAVRHTSLTLFDQEPLVTRYSSCFVQLLNQIDAPLRGLPARVPLEVHLQLPANIDEDEVRKRWLVCWEAAGHRPVDATLIPLEQGVMAIDAWLDIHGGPGLEKFALYVAVQLHEAPPANSAEAAVALLLGWAPLAQRKGLTPQARLHRPVDVAGDEINDTVSRTLLWGGAQAPQIGDLWQAGVEQADKSALMQASTDLSLGRSQTSDLCDIHNIDNAIGDPGVASAWLAIALAAEHAAETAKPQLVVSRQHTLRLAVVQPSRHTQDAGPHG